MAVLCGCVVCLGKKSAPCPFCKEDLSKETDMELLSPQSTGLRGEYWKVYRELEISKEPHTHRHPHTHLCISSVCVCVCLSVCLCVAVCVRVSSRGLLLAGPAVPLLLPPGQVQARRPQPHRRRHLAAQEPARRAAETRTRAAGRRVQRAAHQGPGSNHALTPLHTDHTHPFSLRVDMVCVDVYVCVCVCLQELNLKIQREREKRREVQQAKAEQEKAKQQLHQQQMQAAQQQQQPALVTEAANGTGNGTALVQQLISQDNGTHDAGQPIPPPHTHRGRAPVCVCDCRCVRGSRFGSSWPCFIWWLRAPRPGG